MTFLRNLSAGILYSNLFIAGCAAALYAGSAQRMRLEVDLLELFFVLASTFCIYNVQRLFMVKRDPAPIGIRHRFYLQYIVPLIALSNIALGYMIFYVAQLLLEDLAHVDRIGVFLVCGVISMAYFLPGLDLRRIGILKPFVIGSVWALFLVGRHGFPDSERAWWFFAERMCFISALAMVFDIRDREIDERYGTHTFPVRWGIDLTRAAAGVLMLGSFMISSLVFRQGSSYLFSLPLFLLVLVLVAAPRREWFYLLLVDGIILAQGLTELFLFQNSMR